MAQAPSQGQKPHLAQQKKTERQKRIESIDLLVHPFYMTIWTYYNIRLATVPRTRSEADYEAMQIAERWKDRVKVIQHNPNAALVLLDFYTRRYRRELPDSSLKIIDDFYRWCERALGKRLFMQQGMEIGTSALKSEIQKRGFAVAEQPQVHAYGETWLNCVRDNFIRLLEGMKIPFDRKLRRTKIVHSLCLGEYLDRFAMQRLAKQHGVDFVKVISKDYERARAEKPGLYPWLGRKRKLPR